MFRINALLFVSLFLFPGCDFSPSESFQEKRDRINAKLDAEYANRVSVVNEEARSLLPAKSADDLVKAFELAFNAGDFEAIEQMAHFENLDEAPDKIEKEKESILVGYLAFRMADGESHIKTPLLRDLEEDEAKDFWTLEPVKMYEFEARDDDDSGGSNITVPIVDVDGEFFFYLCTIPPGYFDQEEEEE